MALCGLSAPRLSANDPDFSFSQEVRVQFGEQLKCLDARTESHVSLLYELQDYCRRRSEIELDYSKNLDKLHRQIATKHKAEKQKREGWSNFATYGMWKMLVEEAKVESKNRSFFADLMSNHVAVKVASLADQMQRVTKRCKEVGSACQSEILRVLGELHTALKTYQLCHAACGSAQIKAKLAEAQKCRYEGACPKKIGCRKHRFLEKAYERKHAKYSNCKLKAEKARNEYLLCIRSANAALHKYFAEDLSDIIDCMDIGLASTLSHVIEIIGNTKQALISSDLRAVDAYRDWCLKLDPRADKQRFLESNHELFVLPRRFEFRPHDGDHVKQMTASRALQEDLSQRYWQLSQRLVSLRTELEEFWKTLETTEKSIMSIQQQPKLNIAEHMTAYHSHGQRLNNSCRESEACHQRRREHLCEFEDFYLSKFHQFLLTANLISRLDARYDAIKSLLENVDGSRSSSGRCTVSPSSESISQTSPVVDASNDPLSNAASVSSKPRRKRIGDAAMHPDKRNRLFGGSLEEYVEATGQEIPLIVRSCVRMLSMFGLHHQGIFRVSGSQLEINAFKEAFESGQDPLLGVTDASDVNSVAGVLKLYFRELREPLFPFYMFDQFVECACLETREEFVRKVRELLAKLPRPIMVVMRYLFSFLNHLSEFSDENMMDSYNLAICFGPTLLPIPESKDQVFYHNHVNELMRGLILHHDEVFPNDGGIVYEKYLFSGQDEGDEDEEVAICGDDEDRAEATNQTLTSGDQHKIYNGDDDQYGAIDCSSETDSAHASGNCTSTCPDDKANGRHQNSGSDSSSPEIPTLVNGLLVNELTGYSPTVVSRRSRFLAKGPNAERLSLTASRSSAIYSQPFKINSPTVEESPSPGDRHAAFNWDVSADDTVICNSNHSFSCQSTGNCNKSTFRRLSLSTYTAYAPRDGDESAPPPAQSEKGATLPSEPFGETDRANKVPFPQSLRDIQYELKAVLSSLETFATHHHHCDAETLPESVVMKTDHQLPTPDLVKNLPEASAVELSTSSQEQEPCDQYYVSSLIVDGSTFAERFGRSRECTIRKSCNPGGLTSNQPLSREVLSFPFIDQPSGDSHSDNGFVPLPSVVQSTKAGAKPPVPKKPSACMLSSA